LYWLQTGAQPTDTVRAILSYEGVLYKNHLLKGVKKGALSEEQAEAKFQTWLKEKQEKIANKVKNSVLSEKDDKKKRLEAERKVNEERAKALAAKRAAELGLEEEAKAEETAGDIAENAEAATEEAVETTEEAKEEVKEEVKEEKKEEAPEAEAKEEKKEEAPEGDEKKEEGKSE
jgi:small subunit ribosomal protein S16